MLIVDQRQEQKILFLIIKNNDFYLLEILVSSAVSIWQ